MEQNRYGYKVCYKRKGASKLKIYLITNTYDGAVASVRWYEAKPPNDRKTAKPLIGVIWYVLPIKSFIEYKWRWKGCPF